MPDSKITALTALTAADPAVDMFPVVDVSDTTMAASGTTKRISINNILACSPVATLASLNVTGSSIPANGLYLPTTNTLEFAANSLAQYRIAPLGVFNWYDGAGGTRMTLNATGLGVGKTPAVKLDIGGTGTQVARIQTSTSGDPTLTLEAAGVDNCSILYDRTNGGMRFDISAITGAMRLSTTGNVGIGVTPSAGKGCLQLSSGINFPATQVASSDANTLDDYEEGTFVPTLNSGTFSASVCRYTKIGNMVTVFFDVTVGTGGGDRITNLPFTAGGTVANGIYTNAQDYAAGTTSPVVVVGGSSTTLFFRTVGDNVAFSAMTLTAAANLSGSISYFV